MRANYINFKQVTKNTNIRLDSKYNIFIGPENWESFNEFKNYTKIGSILQKIPIKKFKKGELDNKALIINISDQQAGLGILNLTDESFVNIINSDKTDLNDCEIMISKLGMTRGYIYLNPKIQDIDIIGSSEFIPYKFKDSTEAKFYLYFFLLPQMRKIYANLESGKTPSHKRVNPEDFLKIKIPLINHNTIVTAIKKIEDNEKKYQEIKSNIISQQVIIDEVFQEEFNLPKDSRNLLHKGMTYGTQNTTNEKYMVFNSKLSKFTNTKDLRFSARSQNPVFFEFENILKKTGTIRLKNICTEPIHRGKSPLYIEDGEIPVVKTAHLRNNEVLISDEEFVSEFFFNNKILAQVKKDDILIASTGKPSIGKVDLLEEDFRLFADGHVSIVRIDDKLFSKRFIVYYLRSVLGSYQIEKNFVGCTNQIEIYPEEIENIIIPNISLDRQNQINEKIKKKIDTQNEAINKLSNCRNDIDSIIIQTLQENAQ